MSDSYLTPPPEEEGKKKKMNWIVRGIINHKRKMSEDGECKRERGTLRVENGERGEDGGVLMLLMWHH